MLNDVWTSLVNEVDATKRCYEELEAAMMMTNDHLNSGVSALDTRVDQWEDKFCVLCNLVEDVWTTVNKQQCKMYYMDQRISFYSGSIVQLEGRKVEEVKDHFDVLEQRITGQDDQIRVLLHHPVAAKEGCCHYWEGTPKVISCHCFNMTMKLIGDVCQHVIFRTILNLQFPKLANVISTIAVPFNAKPPLLPCISTPLCQITPRRTKNNIAIGEDYGTITLGIPMGYTAE